MSEKFVILSSCYNKSPYIENWANSILVQKYRPLSVYVANDCSSDNSLSVLSSFEKTFKDHNIEYHVVNNKKRMFCGSSYNNLSTIVDGSFFGVLDTDDVLVNDAVEYVVSIYNKYPDVTWLYTQFDICDVHMNYLHKGISRYPGEGLSMLDLGEKRKHSFSHWRTFSNKIGPYTELFKKGLTCAVDKYMGYRLEEMGVGMFVDRICYRYREGVKRSVVSTEKTKDTWMNVVREARERRNLSGIKAYPILLHKEENEQ